VNKSHIRQARGTNVWEKSNVNSLPPIRYLVIAVDDKSITLKSIPHMPPGEKTDLLSSTVQTPTPF
jgi:hypothetical protein